MRITCANIDDFCEELSREAGNKKVFNGDVFTRIDRAPEQPEKLTWLVVMWATAGIEIQTPEGVVMQILEFGAECGSDDGRDPDGGTKVAMSWLAKVKGIAEAFDLTMRKGKLELI